MISTDFSRTGASPELIPDQELIEQEKWAELSARMSRASSSNELQYLADWARVAGFRDHLAGLAEPTGLELALRARFDTMKAWELRSSARAHDVTEAQWKGFRDWLVKSERAMLELTAREPGLALAWVVRILNSRGLSLGLNETRRRYLQLSKVDPHNTDGQVYLLIQLLPKWGGSWEEAHAFMTECVSEALDGRFDGHVCSAYHTERWLESPEAERKQVARAALPELAAVAQRSVLHPDFGRPLGWVPALNRFAFLFCLAEDYAGAAPFFRAMAGFGSQTGWHLLGDKPQEIFEKYRDRALAKG